MYKIYVHIFPDGRKYVGVTSKENPERRWRKGEKYKVNIRFYNAIKSVGWENIQHQVLETVKDKETAIKKEEYYTLLWRTNEPEFGYNIQVGYIHSNEQKNKLSSTVKGTNNPFYGKHHTQESKIRMSETKKLKNYGQT